jgi:hypothetical protein
MKKISFEKYVNSKDSELISQIKEESLVNEFIGNVLSAIGGAAKGLAGAAISGLGGGTPTNQSANQNLSIQQRTPLAAAGKKKKANAEPVDQATATKIQQEILKIDKKNKTFNAFKTLFPNEVQDVMRIQTKEVVEQAAEDKKLHDNVQGTNRFSKEQLEELDKDKILKTKFQEIMKGNLQTLAKKQISSNYIDSIISGLEYDKLTHKYYLNKPASKNTGSHGWQNHWISVYNGWIAKLNQVKQILAQHKL